MPALESPSEPEAGSLRPRRMPSGRRLRVPRRIRAMALGAALVAVWLVVVFAGILSRADELEATADQARQTRDMLMIQADLVEDEIAFVRSEAFIQQAARAQGLGQAGEQPFRLPEDAPPPPTIRPLDAP